MRARPVTSGRGPRKARSLLACAPHVNAKCRIWPFAVRREAWASWVRHHCRHHHGMDSRHSPLAALAHEVGNDGCQVPPRLTFNAASVAAATALSVTEHSVGHDHGDWRRHPHCRHSRPRERAQRAESVGNPCRDRDEVEHGAGTPCRDVPESTTVRKRTTVMGRMLANSGTPLPTATSPPAACSTGSRRRCRRSSARRSCRDRRAG